MKEYTNQPRKPDFSYEAMIEDSKKPKKPAKSVMLSRNKKRNDKISGGLFYDKLQEKRKIQPNKYVTVKQSNKINRLSGTVSFDLKPLRLTGFGSTTTTKGVENVKVPFGTFETTWKSIENNIGGALGIQINENNRVGIQASKTFFQNQKGSANTINLNYSVQNLGGGELNVSLTGTDPFTGKKTKAMNLQYNLRF